MSKSEDKVRETLEELITELKKQGVPVEGAGYFKLKKEEETKNTPNEDLIDKAVENVFAKLGIGKPSKISVKKPIVDSVKEASSTVDKEDGQCLCPDCFNFSTFEDVLSKYGGHFDYKQVELNGKTFNIKYYSYNSGREHMVISPDKADTPKLDELHSMLNDAVQKKQFDRAQGILNLINSVKTK